MCSMTGEKISLPVYIGVRSRVCYHENDEMLNFFSKCFVSSINSIVIFLIVNSILLNVGHSDYRYE